MVSIVDTPKENDKQSLRWVGPYMVTAIEGDNLYEIQNLFETRSLAHAARLWFYAPDNFKPPAEFADIFQHDFGTMIVDRFIDLRFNTHTGTFEILTQWLGFQQEQATWEPLTTMHEDVPQLLTNFLTDIKTPVAEQAKKFIGKYLSNVSAPIPPQLQEKKARQLDIDTEFESSPTAAPVADLPTISIAPGWHEAEKEILCALIMKYGVGNYRQFHIPDHLPGKTSSK